MPSSAELTHWSLKELLPDPVDQAVEATSEGTGRLRLGTGSHAPIDDAQISAEAFAKVLATLERFNTAMRRLQAYSFLWFAEDTQNEAALNLRDRLDRCPGRAGQPHFVFRYLVQRTAGGRRRKADRRQRRYEIRARIHPALQTLHIERSGGKTSQSQGCERDQCAR